MGIDEYIDDIDFCIKNFDIDKSNYSIFKPSELGIAGDDSNRIYIKSDTLPAHFIISIYPDVKNSKIYIGKNTIKRRKSNIHIQGNKGFFYMGDNVSLADSNIFLSTDNSFVCIGEGVSMFGEHNKWITGKHTGNKSNGIIVGDHNLIAGENIIRASDEHLVIDLLTNMQANISHTPIIIEPYCWLGQRVSLLKNCRIGACSIAGFGSVVTKSCDRFSVLGGVPAKAKSIYGKLWLRNEFSKAKEIFEIYKKRFITEDDRRGYK